MIHFSSRLSRLSVATAILLAAAAPASAEQALLKLGDVKGESTDDKHKGEIQVESFSWGAAEAASVTSSDPQEGGEIVSDALLSANEPGKLETPNPAAVGKVTVSDMPTIKTVDKATPTLRKSLIPSHTITSPRDVATGQATGKRQHKPLAMERGSLTAVVPEGVCVLGARYPTVTLEAGGQVYELSDVTVANCTPVATRKGKKDKAQLDYMVVKMETVLISG